MKKIFVCLLTVVLFVTLCACAHNKLTPSAYQPSDLDRVQGVRATTEQETYPVGTKSVTAILENNSGREITLGISFVLETKDGEAWSSVPFAKDGDIFHSIACIIPDGDTWDCAVDFSRFDYSFPAGEYRVILTGYGEGLPAAYFRIAE